MVPLILLPRKKSNKMFFLFSTLIFLVCGSSNSFVKAYDWPCTNEQDMSLYSDPEDCSKFYHCSSGIPYHNDCPAGLHYSASSKECDWPSFAQCTPTPSTSTPSPPTTPVAPDEGTTVTGSQTTDVPTSTTTTEDPEKPNDKLLIGYFNNWASYRPEGGTYTPSDIPAHLFTHIVYAFAVMNESTYKLEPFDPWIDIDNEYYDKVANDIGKYKTLLGVGGWTDSEAPNGTESKYSIMANDPVKRATFIESALELILNYNFIGMDLDWEYPCFPQNEPGNLEDKQAFTVLVSELKEAFAQHDLMLTAAVSGNPSICELAYDVPAIAQHLDWIGVMSYDYHGHWDNVTGHHAPLYAETGELSCDMSINWWVDNGCSPSKLVMGFPLYARTFTLAMPNQCPQTGVPSLGPGRAGMYTKEPGILAYSEVCEIIDSAPPTLYPSTEEYGACLCFLDQWVSMDDSAMVKRKAEYVKARGLRGMMGWDMTMDLSGSKWAEKNRQNELFETAHKNLM